MEAPEREGEETNSARRQYLSRKSVICEKRAIEVVVINDLSRSYVPLVVLSLTLESFVWESNLVSQLMEAVVSLQVSYYNPMAGLLEP